MSRRRFLGLSATAGAAAAAVTACTPDHAPDSGGVATTSEPSAPPTPGSTTPGPVRDIAEADQPGTTDWHLNYLGPPEAVEAYADKTDVVPGERFDLFISSTAKRIDIEAFRIGWYHGGNARRVWHREGVRVHRQAKPTVDKHTNMVTADWEQSLTVRTDGWPEGAYLLRLSTDDARRYVPMIVRTVDTAGKILLVHATSTWQAYNTWGGHSLYEGPGGPDDYPNRSRVVSFDRPFDGSGADKFLAFERPVVSVAEHLRVPLAYTTSAWVDSDPKLLTKASAIISMGHDEYWTPAMRANVTAARDAGVNIAFLGANACFRRIRYQKADAGAHRQIVCYKSDYRKDPMYPKHPKLVTTDYRAAPEGDPECSLTGTYYEAYPVEGDYKVLTPDSWLFAGTGVKKGTKFKGLIGPEYDRVNPVVKLPRPMQVLSHSPITCKGTHTFADSAYYTTDSGAGVFNTGTMNWTRALLGVTGVDPDTSAFVKQVTANLLTAFKDGPAAKRYPAEDNLNHLKPYQGDPTFIGHDLW